MNILEALDDKRLFASVIRDPATWVAWRAFVATLFGLPLTEVEAAIAAECTGVVDREPRAYAEAWLVCGRRAGKSFTLAVIAVFLALFRSYEPYLAVGERATIMVVAADRRQARTIMRYVRGLLAIPLLTKSVERETGESIDVKGRVTIEVVTASHRATRGYTIAACLADELAFWPSEDSTSPDYEILDAIRPGMATIPGALLLCASSPYARRGALWDAYRTFFGKADATALVWQAPTRTMNPTVPQRVIDAAMERDPAHAAAEYGAQFRRDIEAFLSREVVEDAVEAGVQEIPPQMGKCYFGFVDPSGGAVDSFTLAIGHREGDLAVVDAIRERKPPFSPDGVAKEFAELLKEYGLSVVDGDRYGGEWPRERFSVHGITYRPADLSKSGLYGELLPALNGKRVQLLDHDRLVTQLVGLERRTSRGGRDSIDHAPNSHDDVANAVAGLIAKLMKKQSKSVLLLGNPKYNESDYGDDEFLVEDLYGERGLFSL